MGRDAKEEIKILEKLVKKEKNPKLRDRLRGILLLKKNFTICEVAEILGVTERTLFNWKRRYNQSGYNGLKTNPIPGRNTILNEDDMEKLKELLQMRDHWTSKEVRELIKNEFDIEFTPRHIPRILRKLGMNYSKPYVNDYRRPEDAEDILKKDLRARLWTLP